MRSNSSNRRSRNRGGNRKNSSNRSQVFDSNGPDVRIRGTAFQINEKYLALAKDAAASGDRVLAESYLQHAEHYQRMINVWNQEDEDRQKQQEANRPSAKEQDDADDLGLPESLVGKDASQEEMANV
jgi:hypothetical protein